MIITCLKASAFHPLHVYICIYDTFRISLSVWISATRSPTCACVCSNGSHEPIVFCWCEKRAESLQTIQFYRTHTNENITCCHVSVYHHVHESQVAFHYMCVCVWRLWSRSVGKIAVVLCARAQTSRVTGESRRERERETDRMKDSECSFFYSLRWDDSSIERFTSISLLDLNERESRLFLFKSQTFTLLTSPPSKDNTQGDKETTHIHSEGPHTQPYKLIH